MVNFDKKGSQDKSKMAKVDTIPVVVSKPVRGDAETKMQVETFVSAGGKVNVLAGSNSDSALNKRNICKPQHVRAAQKNIAASQFCQVRKEILRRKSEIAKQNYALMSQSERDAYEDRKRKSESSKSMTYSAETPPQRRSEKLKGVTRRKSDTAASSYRTRTDSNDSSKPLLSQTQNKDKIQSKTTEQTDVRIPFHRRSVVHVSGGTVSKSDNVHKPITSQYGSVVTSQPRASIPPPRGNEMLSDDNVPLSSDPLTAIGYSASGYNLSDIQEVGSVTLTEIVKAGVKDFIRFLYMPFKCCNRTVSFFLNLSLLYDVSVIQWLTSCHNIV